MSLVGAGAGLGKGSAGAGRGRGMQAGSLQVSGCSGNILCSWQLLQDAPAVGHHIAACRLQGLPEYGLLTPAPALPVCRAGGSAAACSRNAR